MKQETFRINVDRFRELLDEKLPEEFVRMVASLLPECEAISVDDDMPGIGELANAIRRSIHEISEPLTAISNYVTACRHLAISGDQQQIQMALDRVAEQIDRARDSMRRLRELLK